MADIPDPREWWVPYVAAPAVRAWRTRYSDDGDIVHVMPVADMMLHAYDEDCVCGPTAQLAPGHDECDHSDIWVHQHHALDGRLPPVLR